MDRIDLRSDTVTWPTPAMREAMAHAPVGDDVYGEDPTVNALEAEAAALLGKEAGLFVASGTMGNLAAVLAHCGRGDEMIVGRQAHIFMYEVGGAAALGGVVPHTLDVQPDGTFDLDALRAAIRGNNIHFPRTKLITLENTHGGRGGWPVAKAFMDAAGTLAREHGLATHLDGARLFNAAAALGVGAAALVAHIDTVTFCLSKGLCAPAGSVVVGPRRVIDEARRVRKMLGGGMRQAGVLAAAGRIALHTMTQRLHEDHANACALAEALARVPGVIVDVDKVRTNFVFMQLAPGAALDGAALAARLEADYGIIVRPYPGDETRFRLVTHYWITQERVRTVADAMQALLA